MYINWRSQLLKNNNFEPLTFNEKNIDKTELYIVTDESTLNQYCVYIVAVLTTRFAKMFFAKITSFLLKFDELLRDICELKKCFVFESFWKTDASSSEIDCR